MTIGIETIVKGSRYMIRYNKRCMIISAEDCIELLELLYLKRDEFRGKVDELTARDEIATWKEVIAEEREQVSDKDGEPFLEDCPWCKGSHTAGTIDQCPLSPANSPQATYTILKPYLDQMWIEDLEITPLSLEAYYHHKGSALAYSHAVLEAVIVLWKAYNRLEVACRNQW